MKKTLFIFILFILNFSIVVAADDSIVVKTNINPYSKVEANQNQTEYETPKYTTKYEKNGGAIVKYLKQERSNDSDSHSKKSEKSESYFDTHYTKNVRFRNGKTGKLERNGDNFTLYDSRYNKIMETY